jgi:hypothetical protein
MHSQELYSVHQQCFLASYVPWTVARVTSCHKPRAVLSTMSPQKRTENGSISIIGYWGCISTWIPLYACLAKIWILFLGTFLGCNENMILLMCLLWCYYGHVMSYMAICRLLITGMGLIPGQLMSGLWWTVRSPSTCFLFTSIILPLLYAPTSFTCHQNHIDLDTDSICYQLPVRVLV